MLRILVLLLLTVQAYGQLNFQTFAPTHQVNGVVVDADGNIWAATNGGVLKYHHEGTLLRTYTNTDGLIHNQVTSILIASNGDIWCGTWNGGISRLHGDKWESYELLVHIGYDIASIAEDARGDIWFSGQHYLSGGARFDGTNMTLVNESTTGIPNNGVSAIAAEGATVWFGATDKIASFDGTNWVTYPGSSTGILAIDIDSNGDKWFAHSEGILRMSGTTFTNLSRTDLGLGPTEYLSTIYIDDDDNIWIGAVKTDRTGDLIRYSIDTQQATRFTEPVYTIQRILKVGNDLYVATGFWSVSGKLYRFDGTNWFEYTKQNTPNTYQTLCSMEDTNGNMWFGTSFGLTPGVAKFDGVTFTEYNLGDVYSLAQTPNGDIFAGKAGSVMIFHNDAWSTSFNAGGYVLQMANDSQGNLWASVSPGGIAKYNGTSWTTYNTSNSTIVSNDVVDLSIDGDDNVWIVYSNSNVISRLSNGTVTTFSSNNSGLAEGAISHILAMPNNTILASVYDKGIYKYELGQWSLLFNEDNSPLPNIYTNEMQLDAAGNYWFAGIVHINGPLFVSVYNGNRWKTYRYEIAGYPVWSLSQDHLGNVWAATQWGITKISGDPFAKVNQTISFDALPTKTFGDAPFNLGALSSSDLVSTYASSDHTVATINGTTVTIVGAGTTTITARQTGNDDYFAAVPVDRLLTVDKASQTITFSGLAAKVFNDAAFDLTAVSDSQLPVAFTSSNSAVATISGKTVTIVGVGTTTIIANQAGNDDYQAALPKDHALVVNKASQQITFNTLPAMAIGDAPFDLTASSNSQLAPVFTSSNTSVATIIGKTVTLVGVGTTTITASQPGDDHYTAAPEIQQSLIVDKRAQTITFNALSPSAFGDGPFNLTAGSDSQLPITYNCSDPTIATISNSTLTIKGAGVIMITASQPGNENYKAATPVDRQLAVSKAGQSITFTQATDRTVGDGSFALSATATSGLAVIFVSTSDKITIAGSQVSVVKAGRAAITASQPGNNNYNAASSVDQTFCIKPAKPVVTLTNANGSGTVLTSSATAGNQWFKDDAALPGGTNGTLTATEAGVYKVQVKVDDCISAFSDNLPLIVTAASERVPQIAVYPNPAGDYIELTGVTESISSVSLFDMKGRISSLPVESDGSVYRSNVQHLAAGIYLLRVQQGTTVQLVKVVKK